MMAYRRITDQLEQLAEQICDYYCKYPVSDEYKPKKGESEDDAMERLHTEMCDHCPVYLNL